MTTLRLENLARSVAGKHLVRDVSFTLADGEINLLLGPNGAGKTSLMRLCAMLDKPTTGRLVLEPAGEEPSDPAANGVTMVFQRPVTLNRTVWQNIAYPLQIRRLNRDEAARRIQEAMAVADLTHLARQNARSISGGEAQRLALARAYVTRPALLLLDEPAANLDPVSRWRIDEMMLEMQNRFGTTVVLTTHDLMHARKIGQKVFFMEQGRVSGPFVTREFFHDPPSQSASRYVAGVLHPAEG